MMCFGFGDIMPPCAPGLSMVETWYITDTKEENNVDQTGIQNMEVGTDAGYIKQMETTPFGDAGSFKERLCKKERS